MANTNSGHGGHVVTATPGSPVQADSVSFRGIIWFLVIILVTTVVCEGLVTGLFKYFEYDVDHSEPQRAATAPAPGYPQIFDGRVVATTPMPEPVLLTDDPETLARFRAQEDVSLTTYGVEDKNAGTYRIPIDKAKQLLLQKGLPARPTTGK